VGQLTSLANIALPSSQLREPAVRALSSIHSRDARPFLASLLTSTDSGERMRGVFGLASFANGCPIETDDNVATMDYLRCHQPSVYRTKDTFANLAIQRGSVAQEAANIPSGSSGGAHIRNSTDVVGLIQELDG